MSKLTEIKRQIAALEAQAERIAKTEMSSAIAKVKDIMSEFNLTIEHLTQSIGGKRATKKAIAKKTGVKKASLAKYADPKTGKTWSGVGRAPGWITGAKNRDAFLIGKGVAAIPAKAPAAAKKPSAKAVKAVKGAKKSMQPAAKKAVAAAKKAASLPAAAAVAKKKAASKRAASKKPARKKAGERGGAAMPVNSTASPAA